jgi:hypothetical protein
VAISSLTLGPIEEVSATEVKDAIVKLLVSVMSLLLAPPSRPAPDRRPLTEDDAVDIWIARWLRIRRRDLIRRYDCDPRRLYEIWEQVRFAGARDKALKVFRARYPGIMDRVDFGPHRRIERTSHPDQLSLFE